MWVIFLLAAMGFAVAMLIILLVANKIYLKIQKDNEKARREIERERKEEEKTLNE